MKLEAYQLLIFLTFHRLIEQDIELLIRCPVFEPFKIQCSSFITHLNITLIWVQHSHVVAPYSFIKEFYKDIGK